jgi:hypothetical protein
MNKKAFHQLIREEYQKLLEEEKLKEGILSWMGGVARNIAYGIIDKRAGYLTQALKYDPKLQRLAKDLKLSTADFESRVTSLLDKDPDFLKALANVKAKRI